MLNDATNGLPASATGRSQYGRFSADGRAFIVDDPQTPGPWTNVVSNGRYGFVVSQRGGGFSWLDNSQLNVVTRWEMDLRRDESGRFLFLADLDDQEVWSIAPAPCNPMWQKYQCEHTFGRTTFTTQYRDIECRWELSVSPDDPVELWRVSITNTGANARRLRLASYMEWCCGVAPDTKREFHRLFLTTEHDANRHAILATKSMWDLPPRNEAEHWNRPWPYAAAHAAWSDAFVSELAVGDKRLFLGKSGDIRNPESMTTGVPPVGGFGRFGDAAACLGGDLHLKPGAKAEVRFAIAIDSDAATVNALLDKYSDPSTVARAIDDAHERWVERLGRIAVKTSREDFDLLNNGWLGYQSISARLWARTGYYQQSGAFGFRDQLQDSQVWLPLEPDRCREQILLHAAHQFSDGRVYHWWHPLSETGLEMDCSDDFLWLPYLTASYLKETGNFAILDETAPFVDDPQGATLLEHCRRSVQRGLERRSDRGIPLIGSCDWNDGLSAMGVGGRGESVWMSFFMAQILGDFVTIFDRVGDKRASAQMSEQREQLLASANAHAWDGAWFRRATDDNGRWIGTSGCDAGRIFLNPQTWAILTDGAAPERLETAWQSVREHLLGDMGPLLLAPAYSVPDASVGYITRYAPGSRENGGVYMHAATWALAAACRMGDAEAVGRIFDAISPPLRSARNADNYAAEPYVTPGNVDGPDSEHPGRAGWTWYTGSSAWLGRVCMQSIVGVVPDWDHLVIDPCLFEGLGEVQLKRTWRGKTLQVHMEAGVRGQSESLRIRVNGRDLADNRIAFSDLAALNGEIRVDVGWGVQTRVAGQRPVLSRRPSQ